MESTVAVVILNWNGKKFLEDFLPGVIEHSKNDAEVYVADNASTDGSVQLLRERFPTVKIILHETNGGYARGYNDALSQIHADYYVLLNCGFRLRPTAGTASGVHPVPLGFGRVFVYLPEPFSYEAWMKGLDEGRSFVTTGPLMSVTVNDQLPGHTFKIGKGESLRVNLDGWVRALNKVKRIEVVANGKVIDSITPNNRPWGRPVVYAVAESARLARHFVPDPIQHQPGLCP